MAGNDYYNRGAGPNFVPAYQISGVPYVTSSNGTNITNLPVKVSFPFATRFFQITNTSELPLRVGFTVNGVNGVGGSVSGSTVGYHTQNYFILSGALANGQSAGPSSVRLEVRCKEIYLRSDSPGHVSGFTLIAGLTGVQSSQFPILSGSHGFEGVG